MSYLNLLSQIEKEHTTHRIRKQTFHDLGENQILMVEGSNHMTKIVNKIES